MKIYEWIILVANSILLYVGYEFWDNEERIPAIACVSTAVAIFAYYVYKVKIRPMGQAKNVFLDKIKLNHFQPKDDKASKKQATLILREFEPFGDFNLQVGLLHTKVSSEYTLYSGRYALSGNGLNFGYFLVAVFQPTKTLSITPISSQKDNKPGFTPVEESALSLLSQNVSSTLRKFPYDFYLQGNLILADFDSRAIRLENFNESLQSMLNTVPLLATS